VNARLTRRAQARGFTLVELLLAITLMSMLLALAYGGLRASTRATDRGQVVLEESGRIRMAHQFVRKQLNQMLPLAFQHELGQSGQKQRQGETLFEGSSDRIRFVGPMPGYLSFGGPQVQEMAIVRSDEGLALVLSHALLQGFEEEDLYERDAIFLMDRIEYASFQFKGLNELGEVSGWMTEWEDPGRLPLAVSLEVEFEEEIAVDWPLLYASVRIDATALSRLVDGSTRSYDSAIRDLINKRKEEE
jgi:general secretion pathway protein J